MRSPRTSRALATATLGVTLGLAAPTLASCAGADDAAPSPKQTALNGTVFNAADATFARELLLQRAEEFTLIDLAAGRTLSPELTAFVENAQTVRSAEVEQVTAWLTDWGKEIPTTARDHASGHGEGAHAFEDVEEASDATFEAAFVEAFLAELEESDDIASQEQSEGLYASAKGLADDVDDSNDDEADVLEDLAG